MIGTIIEIEAVNKIINDFKLPISPKDLQQQLSMCLTETQADLFNSHRFWSVRLVCDMCIRYEETGEFTEPEELVDEYY